MIYLDRRFKRMIFTFYLCFVDGFVIEWRQNVNRKEKIVGIGNFNQQKHYYKYRKKGFSDAMYRRMVNLNKNNE